MLAKEYSGSGFAPTRPLVLAAIAWALGIAVDRHLGILSLSGLWFTSIAALMAATWYWYRQRHRLFTIALVTSLACISASWHHLHWNYIAEDELGRYAQRSTEPLCLEAIIVEPARFEPAPPRDPLRALPTGPTTEFVCRAKRIRNGQTWQDVSGESRIRVTGELPHLNSGDLLRVYGRFRRPSPAMNPGQFDWSLFERGAGRHCEIRCQVPECVTVLESAGASPLSRLVNHLRTRCVWRLEKYVDPENSDLARAVLLGDRDVLSDETDETFLRTGTIHLLVVSGLHVGIVAFAVWSIISTGVLSRRTGLLITALLVITYAAVVGGRPPVIRATVLILLGLLAMIPGRRVVVENLLAVAAMVVLILNPTNLFQSGTQLSFLCVIALAAYGQVVNSRRTMDPLQILIYEYSPWYEKALTSVRRQAVHLALVSCLLWVVVAPLVAYHFHITTPIGILLTPILWPLVVGALATGIAICSVAWVIPPLAALLGKLCSLFLGTTASIVEAAADLGLGSFYCAGPEWWWLFILYLGIALPLLIPRYRMRWQWHVSLAAFWIACGFIVSANKTNEDQLHCTFLSMGHGTCVVLQLPGDQTVLYDAGSLSSPDGATNTIASYLWSEGITRIDAIVLSHADVDHYNAVPGLLERFHVGAVYVSPMMFDPWSTGGQLEAPELLRTKLEEAEVPLREVWMNDRLRVAHPELDMEVLHPGRYGTEGRDNANSIVLLVRFAGHTVLLPGDLESPGLDAVVAEQPLDVDILLAPHHGSVNSDPPGFAAWCTPDWTIVSGPSSVAGTSETESSYRAIGSKVIHTSQSGATRFSVTNQGIIAETYR